MPQPATRHTDLPTAARILDEAEALFAERGFDGASLGEIAGRVGIRPPSVYNHFDGKQALYDAVLERRFQPFFELLDGMLSNREGRAVGVNREDLATAIRHLAKHPNLARLIQQEALARSPQLERLRRRWYRPIFRRARKLLGEDDPGAEVGAGGWTAAERRELLAALNNMIIGYITMAPVHRELLGGDPLARPAVERQIDFLVKVVGRLFGAPPDTPAASTPEAAAIEKGDAIAD